LVDDHHQRWVLDMGLPGPDEGKGGKYLVLPPDYSEETPVGYYVGRANTYLVFVAIRVIPLQGNFNQAWDGLRQVKIYPLSQAENPMAYEFIDKTSDAIDTTCLRWEDNLEYWKTLHAIVDAEPVLDELRPVYDMLGIEKGKPFAPDERMQAMLERAAKMGRDQLLVSAFASQRPDRIAWEDRQWEWVGLQPDSGDFATPVFLDVEARDRWFAQAIIASPAMFRRKVGSGSLYWLCARDQKGAYLDGGKKYKLNVPQPVPAQLFWSVTVYDAETRSQVQTDQDKAALLSLVEQMTTNADGSIDLYFGPTAPEGKEEQWIKTAPGRGWLVYFRIYGPEQPAFDASWKPGDFEIVV
jgi:hypothetical protein